MSDRHAPAERYGGTTAVGTGRHTAARGRPDSLSHLSTAPDLARGAGPLPAAAFALHVASRIGVPVLVAGVGHAVDADPAPALIGPVR